MCHQIKTRRRNLSFHLTFAFSVNLYSVLYVYVCMNCGTSGCECIKLDWIEHGEFHPKPAKGAELLKLDCSLNFVVF